jgi:hypothetical protein
MTKSGDGTGAGTKKSAKTDGMTNSGDGAGDGGSGSGEAEAGTQKFTKESQTTEFRQGRASGDFGSATSTVAIGKAVGKPGNAGAAGTYEGGGDNSEYDGAGISSGGAGDGGNSVKSSRSSTNSARSAVGDGPRSSSKNESSGTGNSSAPLNGSGLLDDGNIKNLGDGSSSGGAAEDRLRKSMSNEENSEKEPSAVRTGNASGTASGENQDGSVHSGSGTSVGQGGAITQGDEKNGRSTGSSGLVPPAEQGVEQTCGNGSNLSEVQGLQSIAGSGKAEAGGGSDSGNYKKTAGQDSSDNERAEKSGQGAGEGNAKEPPRQDYSQTTTRQQPTERKEDRNSRKSEPEGQALTETEKRTTNQRGEDDQPQDKLQDDEIVGQIREWLLQERLLILELKKFKPVRQPNNPNPPWEYYFLRQKQILEQLKRLRRRIEFLGKKDEYFIELKKLSKIANRLLELMNTGQYTEYSAAAKTYDDLLLEIDSIPDPTTAPNSELASYRPDADTNVPKVYRDNIARYFERLSEG